MRYPIKWLGALSLGQKWEGDASWESMIFGLLCDDSRWREGFCVADAGGFYDGVDGVSRYILKAFDFAAGPADFYRLDFCGFAEAEVEAQIVLRKIAVAAADFCHLAHASGADGHAGADSGAIALCANHFEQHAVVAIVVFVEQESGWFADIDQNHVNVPRIKNVAEGRPTPRF